METQNDDPKVVRSEWKVWLEVERADYYEDGDEEYEDEQMPRGVAYRPTLKAATELMEEIEATYSEVKVPGFIPIEDTPPAKKYYLYNIKIQNGEYEYSSKSVHTAPPDGDEKKHADEYVSDFYGSPSEKDGDWYYFNGGEIAAKMLSVQEITKVEYDVFRKFYF